MRTTKWLACLLALGCAGLLVSCETTETPAKSARRDLLYVCGCGADCKCSTVSTKAGKCSCGHALKAERVVRVEGDSALLCACGADCNCSFDPKEPAKCGCGKPIHKVSLKGSGVYFCNCGGSCSCNTISDKPDQCKCGMPLKRAG